MAIRNSSPTFRSQCQPFPELTYSNYATQFQEQFSKVTRIGIPRYMSCLVVHHSNLHTTYLCVKKRLRPAPLQRQLNVETSIDSFYCTVERLPTEDDVAGLLSAYNETLHANSRLQQPSKHICGGVHKFCFLFYRFD